MSKRMISVILAVVLLLGCLPFTASAAGSSELTQSQCATIAKDFWGSYLGGKNYSLLETCKKVHHKSYNYYQYILRWRVMDSATTSHWSACDYLYVSTHDGTTYFGTSYPEYERRRVNLGGTITIDGSLQWNDEHDGYVVKLDNPIYFHVTDTANKKTASADFTESLIVPVEFDSSVSQNEINYLLCYSVKLTGKMESRDGMESFYMGSAKNAEHKTETKYTFNSYTEALQYFISKSIYHSSYYDRGMFLDINNDGEKELLLTRFDSSSIGTLNAMALAKNEDGSVYSFLPEVFYQIYAGGPRVEMWTAEKDGKKCLAVNSRNSGGGGTGHISYGRYTLWELTENSIFPILSANEPDITVRYSIQYEHKSDGKHSVVEDECAISRNGEKITYREYEKFLEEYNLNCQVDGTLGDDFKTLLEQAREMEDDWTVSTNFPDVSASEYYYCATMWGKKNNVINGYPDGKFRPEGTCTRAEAMAMLAKLSGSPGISYGSSFRDVKANDWFYGYVNWGVVNGVTNGTGNNNFSPNAKCTRAEIVMFLWNLAGNPSVSGSSGFKDVKSSDWYCQAVNWAVSIGITTGTGPDKFSPDDYCTRGQMITLIYRYAN